MGRTEKIFKVYLNQQTEFDIHSYRIYQAGFVFLDAPIDVVLLLESNENGEHQHQREVPTIISLKLKENNSIRNVPGLLTPPSKSLGRTLTQETGRSNRR